LSTNRYSRRDFLSQLGWLTTLGTFGGLAAASGRYMVPNVLYEPPKEFKIGSLDDFPEGVDFLSDRRIFVVHEKNVIRVVSAVCTHLGCTVNWVAERNRWECPCHGSIFNQEGMVIRGPARRPLPWYEVSFTPDGRLLVNERRIVPFTEALSVKT
jgi:cytochrome b6-f complex iron-sulfur subunit